MSINNNMNNIKIQVLKNCKINGNESVKLTRQGENYAEVMACERKTKVGARKLNKDEYVVLKTGEIKQYQKYDMKTIHDLKKTFGRLRALIRTNFGADKHNQLFLTLTYNHEVNEKELYNDFKNFYKRLKYAYKEHKFDYITVAEPQGSGRWHLHVMLKSDKEILYIDNRKLEGLWEQGYTEAQRLKSDDVGSYYVAYFTDILETGADEADGAEKSKKRKKGERLKFYPVGFKFYRTSRGIKKPNVEMIEYCDVVAEYGEPIFSQTYEIFDENQQQAINRIYKSTHKKQDNLK